MFSLPKVFTTGLLAESFPQIFFLQFVFCLQHLHRSPSNMTQHLIFKPHISPTFIRLCSDDLN